MRCAGRPTIFSRRRIRHRRSAGKPELRDFTWPVAVYALSTRFLDWKMWVFTPAGHRGGVALPMACASVLSRLSSRLHFVSSRQSFRMGLQQFHVHYLNFIVPTSGPSPVFADLVPIFVTAVQAPMFLILAFGVLAIASFDSPAHRGRLRHPGRRGDHARQLCLRTREHRRAEQYRVVSVFPHVAGACRWFLRGFCFWWLNNRGAVSHKKWTRWITRGILAMLLCAALYFTSVKEKQLPDAIDAELNPPGLVICPAVPVANLYAMAREVKKVADAQHADLLIVGGGDRQKHVDVRHPRPARHRDDISPISSGAPSG